MANEKRLIDANALQFEPDENCAANGVLIWGSRTGGKTMTTVLHALKKMVDNAPTVDAVEVVHGRWLPDMEEFDDDPSVGIRGGVFQTGWKCSICGRYERVKEPYCNCGAKMDGGNEND